MKSISNLKQAKSAVDEINESMRALGEFLSTIESRITGLEGLRGGGLPNVPSDETDFTPNDAALRQIKPNSLTERVLSVFQQIGNPMNQSEVNQKYIAMGFPADPDPKKQYNAIASTMAYLTKKKGLLEKAPNGDGYRIKAIGN